MASRPGPASRHVALLRGINVGGRNPIRMAHLKACFEECGFHGVATYIQSGNVVFETGDGSGVTQLTTEVEEMLQGAFGLEIPVVVVAREKMREIVDCAPPGFGLEPDRYRYDVVFLKPPLTAADAISEVPVQEDVDNAHAGPGALYFSRVIAQASRSRLSRLVSLPIYQSTTIRNWNTTTRLLELLER